MTQSINNINQAAYKQQKFIFRSSGAQTRVRPGWVLVSALFQVAHCHFSLCPHVAERGQASSLASSYKGTNLIYEGPTLTT